MAELYGCSLGQLGALFRAAVDQDRLSRVGDARIQWCAAHISEYKDFEKAVGGEVKPARYEEVDDGKELLDNWKRMAKALGAAK